jgi:hypothetical protein
MLPTRDSPESETFHESLHASLDLEGTLWECPKCGRLLFRRPGEKGLFSFAPERVNRRAPNPDAPSESD